MHDGMFELVFAGRLLPGRELSEVKANLAELFKAQPAQMEVLFSGREVVLKKQLDYPGALRYVSALKQAGALCRIRPMDEATTAPAPAIAAAMRAESAPVAATEPKDETLSLAPAGADLLESVVKPVPPAPDTSYLSVAASGADLLEGVTRAAPPPPPDTAYLSVAAPGTELSDGRPRELPPAPPTEHLSLAAVGADLNDPQEKPPLIEPDTSYLSLDSGPVNSSKGSL